jgi:hypothetical protein
MTEFYSKEKIQCIYNENISKFTNPAFCLAKICYDYNLRPCSIQKCGIPFKERQFWKQLRNIKRGNGDGKKVLIYIDFINNFFFLKLKGRPPLLNNERNDILLSKIKEMNVRGISPPVSSLSHIVYYLYLLLLFIKKLFFLFIYLLLLYINIYIITIY